MSSIQAIDDEAQKWLRRLAAVGLKPKTLRRDASATLAAFLKSLPAYDVRTS
jgi:hypothetical protein